jgi:hypothetical protein
MYESSEAVSRDYDLIFKQLEKMFKQTEKMKTECEDRLETVKVRWFFSRVRFFHAWYMRLLASRITQYGNRLVEIRDLQIKASKKCISYHQGMKRLNRDYDYIDSAPY